MVGVRTRSMKECFFFSTEFWSALYTCWHMSRPVRGRLQLCDKANAEQGCLKYKWQAAITAWMQTNSGLLCPCEVRTHMTVATCLSCLWTKKIMWPNHGHIYNLIMLYSHYFRFHQFRFLERYAAKPFTVSTTDLQTSSATIIQTIQRGSIPAFFLRRIGFSTGACKDIRALCGAECLNLRSGCLRGTGTRKSQKSKRADISGLKDPFLLLKLLSPW